MQSLCHLPLCALTADASDANELEVRLSSRRLLTIALTVLCHLEQADSAIAPLMRKEEEGFDEDFAQRGRQFRTSKAH